MPAWVTTEVITPCGEKAAEQPESERYVVTCFRYAPWRWQRFAQGPGGIPAALKQNILFRLLVIPFSLAMLLACFRAARTADVIHANWSVSGVIAGIAGRVARKPIITTLRGSDVSRSASNIWIRLLLKLCFRLSDRLVAVGQSIRNEASRILKVDPTLLHVVTNGVDPSFFALSPPFFDGTLRIITVGSLVTGKDVNTVLRALSLLPSEMLWEFTIAGEGPERSRLEALGREYGISSRLRLAGSVPPRDIPELLARNQVFVLASRSEGRPNAMLEALAAGRAVVASRIPANMEILEDRRSGMLFEPGDAQTLARHFQRLFENPDLLSSLGAQGRESVSRLRWEDTGRSYAALYEELLAGGNGKCAV
jgi:glycosyltransferase involved in cell wall biosynthesis